MLDRPDNGGSLCQHSLTCGEGADLFGLPEPPLVVTHFTAVNAGMMPGTTYCWRMTITTSTSVSTMLCTKVRARTAPSRPFRLVTDTPVAMVCGEIILPRTPPDELVAANSKGFRFSCRAATTCRFPNSALPDVSLPERNNAIQPRKGENRMNALPLEATARPSV